MLPPLFFFFWRELLEKASCRWAVNVWNGTWCLSICLLQSISVLSCGVPGWCQSSLGDSSYLLWHSPAPRTEGFNWKRSSL